MYEIKKDIPVESRRSQGKWDFLMEMDIGDSFDIPVAGLKEATARRHSARTAFEYRKMKCCARWKKDEQVLRVWRIE